MHTFVYTPHISFILQGADLVSDSGGESATEDSRRRTAHLFMSGIQSAITSTLQADSQVLGASNILTVHIHIVTGTQRVPVCQTEVEQQFLALKIS